MTSEPLHFPEPSDGQLFAIALILKVAGFSMLPDDLRADLRASTLRHLDKLKGPEGGHPALDLLKRQATETIEFVLGSEVARRSAPN